MEFWATEVKSGETFKVVPGHDTVLHLSQANLGEIKKGKGSENVYLFVNVGGQKLVLGTLSSERLPQQQFDLVFDQDFELSHNWKGGSVYFFGYKAANDIGDEDEGAEFDSDSEDEDVDIPLNTEITGKPETKVKEEKTVDVKKVNAGKDSSTDKKKVNLETANGLPKNDGSEDEDSDDEDDSISDDEGDDMDEDDEDDSEDDEDDSEEEEKPAKAVPGKKRSSDAEPETPASKKKAKVITPQKTDGKKGGVHVSTPHPSKPAGKKASATENPKSPKSSGGSHVCKSCSRSFGTEGALDSHSKAKHSAGK